MGTHRWPYGPCLSSVLLKFPPFGQRTRPQPLGPVQASAPQALRDPPQAPAPLFQAPSPPPPLSPRPCLPLESPCPPRTDGKFTPLSYRTSSPSGPLPCLNFSISKRRLRASNGQRYPLSCHTHLLKFRQGMISYRTEEGTSVRPWGQGLSKGGLGEGGWLEAWNKGSHHPLWVRCLKGGSMILY